MTNHLAAFATQVAGLPFVRTVTNAVGEPSALAVILTACGALVAGRDGARGGRVEVMAQVKDPRLTDQLDDIFESALDPTTRCWILRADGGWAASPAQGESVREHQVELMRSRRSQGS